MNLSQACGDNLVVNAIVGSLIGHGTFHVLWCYTLQDVGYDLVHMVHRDMLVVNKEMKIGIDANFMRITYEFVKRQREHVVLRICAKCIA